MTTKTKTTKSAESAVLDAAAEAVSLSIVKPSDVAGEPANIAVMLDREIRAGFTVVLESQNRLVALVKEAKDSQIHKMLTDPETGKAYKSWTAYIGNVIAGLDMDVKRLSARDKAFLVVMLYNTGMSQKVIASALAVGVGTVNRAIQAGRADGSVDAGRETESKDGRTFKDTEKDGAKDSGAKATKTPAQKADAHVKALTNLLDQMSSDELTEFKKSLTALGREVTKAVKSA